MSTWPLSIMGFIILGRICLVPSMSFQRFANRPAHGDGGLGTSCEHPQAPWPTLGRQRPRRRPLILRKLVALLVAAGSSFWCHFLRHAAHNPVRRLCLFMHLRSPASRCAGFNWIMSPPALTAELRALKNFRRSTSREASSDAFPRFRDSTIWTDQRSGVEDGVARVK